MLKKKTVLLLTLLLCVAFFYSCGRMDEDQSDVFVDENSGNKIAGEEEGDEIQGINSQTAYVDESENQEDKEPDKTDMNSDDDNDSMEKIKKYMIPEQSFDVTLDDWGEVTFVSCRPVSCDFEASFFLIRDDQILYKFPYLCEDNKKNYTGCFADIGAVAFRDINDDGKEDIIIIFNYYSGAGPTGMVPRPESRIFLAGENEFYLAEDIMEDVEQNLLRKEMTVDRIYQYILSEETENGASKVDEAWQDAYKGILRDMENNLSDPYAVRNSSESDEDSVIGFVGIHDFNHDNIPELIVSDLVSMGVFTFEDGVAKKIADLYEPEDWCYISGVYCKNNTIVLSNSGSDGGCYVCFTFYEGEESSQGKYIIGIYDEYRPGSATINGEAATEEEFKKWFNLPDLLEDSFIHRSRIKMDNGMATDFVIDAFKKDYEYISIEDLNFNLVEW